MKYSYSNLILNVFQSYMYLVTPQPCRKQKTCVFILLHYYFTHCINPRFTTAMALKVLQSCSFSCLMLFLFCLNLQQQFFISIQLSFHYQTADGHSHCMQMFNIHLEGNNLYYLNVILSKCSQLQSDLPLSKFLPTCLTVIGARPVSDENKLLYSAVTS